MGHVPDAETSHWILFDQSLPIDLSEGRHIDHGQLSIDVGASVQRSDADDWWSGLVGDRFFATLSPESRIAMVGMRIGHESASCMAVSLGKGVTAIRPLMPTTGFQAAVLAGVADAVASVAYSDLVDRTFRL